MEDKKLLRLLTACLCAVLFVGLLLGAGYALNVLLVPPEITQEPTNDTSEPTEEPTPPTEPPLTMPEVTQSAKRSFIYILETDEFLMLKGNEDDKLYPASLTKLFSTYVALLYLDAETTVKVGNEVLQVSLDSSKAGLTPGDVLTVRQLVEAMLLPSGNDAAATLAAAAGRKLAEEDNLSYKKAIARFVEEMNAVAQAEGLTGSHFVNPDGYHNKDHYTTCRDMQKIGVLALNQPVIRQAMGTQKVVVDLQYDFPGGWKNTNKLIHPDEPYYNPDALGMKTGYTGAAGYCLMSAFAAEGRTVLIGVFGCSGTDNRFADAQNIYNAYMQHNKNTLG